MLLNRAAPYIARHYVAHVHFLPDFYTSARDSKEALEAGIILPPTAVLHVVITKFLAE